MRKLTTFLSLVLSSASLLAQGIESVVSPLSPDRQVIVHTGYTCCYNSATLQPDWVCWELTPGEVVYDGDVRRCDEFSVDPLVKGRSSMTFSYSRTGFDRGHMAPAADFRWSQAVQDESFLLSNVCLQNHTLNEKTWCDLEKRCRTWCKSYYKTALWIACGPLFGDDPALVGQDGMPVPSGFWKVVGKMYGDKFECVGFVFPNSPCEDDFRNYAVSVDEVERLTGFDFFSAVPDAQENQAESTFDIRWWK